MNKERSNSTRQNPFDPFTMPPLYVNSAFRDYIQEERLPPYSVVVLVWVTSRTGGCGGKFYETVGNLAVKLGISEGTARKALKDLEARSVLQSTEHRGRPTLYQVQPYAQWKGVVLDRGEQEVEGRQQEEMGAPHELPTPAQQVPTPRRLAQTKLNPTRGNQQKEVQGSATPRRASVDDRQESQALVAAMTERLGGELTMPERSNLEEAAERMVTMEPPVTVRDVHDFVDSVSDKDWPFVMKASKLPEALMKSRAQKASGVDQASKRKAAELRACTPEGATYPTFEDLANGLKQPLLTGGRA